MSDKNWPAYPQFIITQIFHNVTVAITRGIFLSGQEEIGEYKKWFADGKLQIHMWFNKKHRVSGQRKEGVGNNFYNSWYDKDGRVTHIPDNVKLKEGYILDGEGHYHKD